MKPAGHAGSPCMAMAWVAAAARLGRDGNPATAASPPITTARRERLMPVAAELRKRVSGAGGIALRLLCRPAFYHREAAGLAGYF